PFAEQDPVAGLDVGLDDLAGLVAAAGPHRGSPDFKRDDFDADGVRCSLDLAYLARGVGIADIAQIANRRRPGMISRKSWSFLPAVSGAWLDSPVTLPPGRARLATIPLRTGSPAVANTIGISDVACFAARGGGVLCVTITSTLSRTNSFAISAR